VKSTLTRVALCLAVFAFSLSAFAASKHGNVQLTKNNRVATTSMHSKIVAQNIREDAKLTKVFSNISKYPFARYFCCYGWTISGPSSQIGEQIWLAAPFTPSSKTTAKKVEVSAGWFLGTDSLVVGIAEDDGGVPGDMLASKLVNNVFEFGTCCTLTTAFFSKGVALDANTQYWVVMSTNSKDEDFGGAWAINTTDDRNYTFATNTGTGWATTSAFLGGYAVLGE